jgi:hypothetical protein
MQQGVIAVESHAPQKATQAGRALETPRSLVALPEKLQREIHRFFSLTFSQSL